MDIKEKNYKDHCRNLKVAIQADRGIIVGSDLTQEWLLPWWWERYNSHNTFPVTFMDMGLSKPMQNWCLDHGKLVKIGNYGQFVTDKEELDPSFVSYIESRQGKRQWQSRRPWFLKPLACLHAPYQQNLWIDLDCEIRGTLDPVFSLWHDSSDIALAKEPLGPLDPYYNSGVIGFSKHSTLILAWALEAFHGHLIHPGDQDLLSALIAKLSSCVTEIPPTYNWSRLKGDNSKAIIYHWHGIYGKTIISHMIQKKKLPLAFS